ncbi:hypothetical protein HYT23_05200 [Candidatus Pacearchaeota archaeon]|nr:hypothetical protein [Candidatus Pacearchaeota archaeon]
MGLIHFAGFGKIANAGLGDEADGKVHDAIEALPRNCFYWLGGDNPTSICPYAGFKGGRIVIDVKDDNSFNLNGGRPAIGINIPHGADVNNLECNKERTIFSYQGNVYEVRHLTSPFYGKKF